MAKVLVLSDEEAATVSVALEAYRKEVADDFSFAHSRGRAVAEVYRAQLANIDAVSAALDGMGEDAR